VNTTRKTLAGLALCLLVLPAGEAAAWGSLRDSWKLQYPDADPLLVSAANACTLCHLPNTKNPRNPYGITLETLSYTQAESVDSDGDGVTNGDEILLYGTLPGDATSPTDVDTWGTVKALFR